MAVLLTYEITGVVHQDFGDGFAVRATWPGYDQVHEIIIPNATPDDYLAYIPAWAATLFRESYTPPPPPPPPALDALVGDTATINPDDYPTPPPDPNTGP